MGTPLWGCTICDHDVCSRCYDEALSGAERSRSGADDERYGEKDNKWQQWLARYISPETEAEDYLSTVGVEPAVSVLPETRTRGARHGSSRPLSSAAGMMRAAPPRPRCRQMARNRHAPAGSPISASPARPIYPARPWLRTRMRRSAQGGAMVELGSDRHASSIPMPTSLTASFGARRP